MIRPKYQDVTAFRSKLSLDDMSIPTLADVKRVAFVGDYLPRKCGIATFTHDLRCGFAKRFSEVSCHVCAVNDIEESYNYPEEVRFEFSEQDPTGYQRLADYINTHKVDAVSLQHEYGIYGGDCGEMILSFLRDCRVPVVTTLHTILQDPNPQQRRVMSGILALSARVITMTEKGRSLLETVYRADRSRVDVIPHGIPEFVFGEPNSYKEPLGLAGHRVALTFGLLSPNKGLEYAIKALPKVVEEFPDLLYVILGQTHPNLIRDHGEAYRNSLQWLANDLGVGNNVRFVNCFVDMDLLKQYIAAADVYITPYLHEAQITSGTLSYAYGMGTAVISTPYWHAVDLLGDGRGIIVPFRDSENLTNHLSDVLRDDKKRQALRVRAFELGRSMTWGKVSEMYHDSFDRARFAPRNTSRFVMENVDPVALPTIKLSHFRKLLDRTGILRYCCFTVPEFQSGYSMDDNALALTLLTTLVGKSHKENEVLSDLASTLLSFLVFALDKSNGHFRSKLSYDRRWADVPECERHLSHARAMSAAGHCCRNGVHIEVAKRLFLESMANSEVFIDPITIGYALDGCTQYLIRYVADAPVVRLRETLANKLVTLFNENCKSEWEWFAPQLEVANGIVPHALISAGADTSNDEWLQVGLKSLGWLCNAQTFIRHDGAFFAPAGPQFVPNVPCAVQLPLGVATTISAAVEAFRRTSNTEWMDIALTAVDWFLGKNCIGTAVYDPLTGGCCDSIEKRCLNRNQGAEATVCFLLSLAEARSELKHTDGDTPLLSAF